MLLSKAVQELLNGRSLGDAMFQVFNDLQKVKRALMTVPDSSMDRIESIDLRCLAEDVENTVKWIRSDLDRSGLAAVICQRCRGLGLFEGPEGTVIPCDHK